MDPKTFQAESTYLYYGGFKNVERSRALSTLFSSSEILKNQFEYFSSSLTEKLSREMEILRELIALQKARKIKEQDYYYLVSKHTPHSHVLEVHNTIFSQLLGAFATEEQKAVFTQKVSSLELLGSVALGELDLSNGKETGDPYKVYHKLFQTK